MSIAAGGLQAAARSLETAARNIVAASTHADLQSGNGADAAQASHPAAQALSPAPAVPVFEVPDLGASVVDLKLAEISYKAQIEVLKAASRLEDEALNLIA